ncbi:ICP22 family protein [Nonomuraea turcica]|uniref:hypothetical protein n=1 Tax=Nonomuraea sp. G32 TaxID=3067274 RepID=UPI00273ABB1A|nr:hypothetical protein [Nonomuraea sp. G32]MDP4510410.1 hypothetical protein [Nonomuraea sp. G32]
MNFCLSDLVPPLRWSDASTITLLTGQPDLPDAWWRSLPMPHVLAAIGPESLGELLTEIALEQWPAAALGDVLPALHVLDPDDADEPAVAIALDRAGSWPGLLGLTSQELVDQPFIQARPVLNTLFAAVFARIASPQAARTASVASSAAGPAPAAAIPAPRDEQHGLPQPTEPASAPEPEPAPEPVPATEPVAEAPQSVPAPQEPAQAAHAPVEHEAAALAEGDLQPAAAGADGLESAPQEAAAQEGAAQQAAAQQAAAQQAAAQQAAAQDVPEGAAPVLDADAEPAVEAGDGPEPVLHAAEEPTPEPSAEEAAAFAEEAPRRTPEAEGTPEQAAEAAGAPEEGAAPVLYADADPAVEAGDGPEPVLHAAEEPTPEPSAEEAAAFAEEARRSSPEDDGAPEQAVEAEDAPEEGAEVVGAPEETPEAVGALEESPQAEGALQESAEAEGALEERPQAEGAPEESAEAGQADEEEEPAAAEAHEQELPQLIESAFAGLDDKSWAVAQNRVFTDEPSAVDQLAKLFAVPPAEISATEDEFRDRLNRWLASEEAAPYRAHLDELRRTLGPAAPKEQLIGAADWHRVEIRALEVPAWQFVLATLPGQAQPVAQQPQIDLPPPPRPHPPMELPPQSAFGHVPMPPPPGPPQFQAFAPAAPPPGESNGGQGEQKPYQPLKDVSQTRRCFRQPDGRWWLRIDVTAEQLAGGECALPTGFASYLGLSPGESRTVRSAAGELTMTWHGRPVLESIERLLVDVGAREGGHLFLTLSDEGVLRARHLPVAAQGAEKITKALRLVGYTAPGGTKDQAARVIATRIGMTGPVSLPDLLVRLRERGDRDLLALLD